MDLTFVEFSPHLLEHRDFARALRGESRLVPVGPPIAKELTIESAWIGMRANSPAVSSAVCRLAASSKATRKTIHTASRCSAIISAFHPAGLRPNSWKLRPLKMFGIGR